MSLTAAEIRQALKDARPQRPQICAACRYWAPDLRPVTATLPGDGDCGVAPRMVRRRGAMVACKEGEVR